MNQRNKKQIFHHKTEEQGGARNEVSQFLEEAKEAADNLCFSCSKQEQKYTDGLCEDCHKTAMNALNEDDYESEH